MAGERLVGQKRDSYETWPKSGAFLKAPDVQDYFLRNAPAFRQSAMFDFDELSECEGEENTDTGDEGAKRSPSPGETEAPPDPSVELREKCERCGLCVTWGPDSAQMARSSDSAFMGSYK
eukprot:s4926_g2.t1